MGGNETRGDNGGLRQHAKVDEIEKQIQGTLILKVSPGNADALSEAVVAEVVEIRRPTSLLDQFSNDQLHVKSEPPSTLTFAPVM